MSEAHIAPEDYINYYTKTNDISIADIGVAPLVVGSWFAGVIHSLAEKCKAVPQDNWVGGKDRLFTSEINNQRVSFFNLRVGACTSVMEMEELIACGARTFIGLGWAGSLQPNLPVGSLIIPIDCISEEGTSAHYKKPNSAATANNYLKDNLELAAKLLNMKTTPGTQWTTDAPYRELKTKVERYREMGVLGVDLETSAMYSLAAYREVRVCNLLVVSDELWHEWRPAFDSPELAKATSQAQDVIIKCLDKITRDKTM